eukprot:2932912-Amphidinium_carterae.1
MLSNFRNRMRQLDNDMNNGQGGGDRPSGRGVRRRGHGGGDDGGDHDPGDHASSSTSQAGERYGPKRWLASQKTATKELELFRQRKTLPKLTLSPNWGLCSRHLFANCLRIGKARL